MCVCMCQALMSDCTVRMCENEKKKPLHVFLKFVLLFPSTREIPPSKGPSQLVCIPAKGIPAL